MPSEMQAPLAPSTQNFECWVVAKATNLAATLSTQPLSCCLENSKVMDKYK